MIALLQITMETLSSVVLVLLLLSGNARSSDLTEAPGHLKRFGEGKKSATPIEEMEGFPGPAKFFLKHIRKQKPLLMKGAAKMSPAFRLWTDEYLSQNPEAKLVYVGVEQGKKEDRFAGGFDSTFSGFLDIYKDRDVYLVTRTPMFLRRDLMVPCPIQCDKLLKNHVHTIYMWFSSGGTKSVVHNDNLENINCLIRGDKQLVMVDPSKYTIPFDHADQGFTSVDVDSVDYTKYPWAAEVEYQHVNMTEGDCLYIPTNWYHQVNSNGSNLAVNIWVEPENMQTYDIQDCNKHCDLSLTLDKARLLTPDKDVIIEAVPEDALLTTEEFLKIMVDVSMMEYNAVLELQEFQSLADMVTRFLKSVDLDEDGRVSKADLKKLSPKQWHNVVNVLETVQLMMPVDGEGQLEGQEGASPQAAAGEQQGAATDKQGEESKAGTPEPGSQKEEL